MTILAHASARIGERLKDAGRRMFGCAVIGGHQNWAAIVYR
jgi:hypothetical protein